MPCVYVVNVTRAAPRGHSKYDTEVYHCNAEIHMQHSKSSLANHCRDASLQHRLAMKCDNNFNTTKLGRSTEVRSNISI